jgi:2-methylcitrate dehydratase PrpD
MPTVSRQIAEFVTGVNKRSVPPQVWEGAKDRLLDAVSTAVASRNVAATKTAVDAARAMGAGSSCTILPTGETAGAGEAALANGVAVHAILYEDINLGSFDHPGAVVVPAALAAAESAYEVLGRRATVGDLLAGILSGYEVHLRLGAIAAQGVYDRGLRTTAVFGTVGAAAAAASIWHLPVDRTDVAVTLGANTAFGFLEGFAHGTQEPYLQAGMAARAGLVAAHLARAGAQTAAVGFEGRSGYFHGLADLDPGPREFPDRWMIRGVTAKPYPISGGKISPVDSARAAAEQISDPSQIERVLVLLPPGIKEFPGGDKKGPFITMYAAQDSTQFCVGAALLGRSMSALRTVMHEFTDSEVSDLTQVIELRSDPGRELARVEATMKDGSTVIGEVDWSDRQIPTVESMSAKLREIGSERLTPQAIESVISVADGDPATPIDKLSAVLQS